MIVESITIEIVGEDRTLTEEIRDLEEVRTMLRGPAGQVLCQVTDTCDFYVERLTVKVAGEKRTLTLGFLGGQVEVILGENRPLLSLLPIHSPFEE